MKGPPSGKILVKIRRATHAAELLLKINIFAARVEDLFDRLPTMT
jgi:hypothetical protein